MKKALVFGVSGQDGSYMAELLCEKGYNVYGTSRSKNKYVHDLTDRPNFYYVYGDITNETHIHNIFSFSSPFDEIYNFAGQTSVSQSIKNPTETFKTNIIGPLNIISAIEKYSPQAKFFQASSIETLRKSPYGLSKSVIDNVLEFSDINFTIGVFSNHESPRRGKDFVTRKVTRWIGDFIRWQKQSLPDYGNKVVRRWQDDDFINYCINEETQECVAYPKLRLGNIDSRRDFGHAKDYVRLSWQAVQENRKYVSICTGKQHSVKEFISEAFSIAGIFNWEDYITIDDEFYRQDARTYTPRPTAGFIHSYNFKQIVEEMVLSDIR